MFNKIGEIFSKDYDWEKKVYLLLSLTMIGPAIILYSISKLALLALVVLMIVIKFNPTKLDPVFLALVGSIVFAAIITIKNLI